MKGSNTMSQESLGMIETKGLAAAIEAIDTMAKSANIAVLGYEKVGAGIITVMVRGDVGAVQAAVEAGKAAAERIGTVLGSYVIPRPHADTEKILAKQEA
jgi:microcompartment protein CcmL/EutN